MIHRLEYTKKKEEILHRLGYTKKKEEILHRLGYTKKKEKEIDVDVKEKIDVDVKEEIDRFGNGGARSFNYVCEGKRHIAYGVLVKRYAWLGLHRYNLLQGTNLQFHSLKSFNKRIYVGPCNYYITVAAREPASGFQQNFQVQVAEERIGLLDLTCSIARPQGQDVITTKSSNILERHKEPLYGLYKGSLPDWPSETAVKDTNRFYVMKKPELRDNDWVYSYLELAACCSSRGIDERSLSKLEIVEAAIETFEDVDVSNARLNTKTAIVYIKYRDWARARIRKPIDRKAIVRRVINEHSGCLTLLGRHWSAEEEALGTEVRSKNILSYEPSLTDEQRSKRARLG